MWKEADSNFYQNMEGKRYLNSPANHIVPVKWWSYLDIMQIDIIKE